MKIILMRLRITIAMLEIRNRETLQSKVNICKSDVKIGDYADSLMTNSRANIVETNMWPQHSPGSQKKIYIYR